MSVVQGPRTLGHASHSPFCAVRSRWCHGARRHGPTARRLPDPPASDARRQARTPEGRALRLRRADDAVLPVGRCAARSILTGMTRCCTCPQALWTSMYICGGLRCRLCTGLCAALECVARRHLGSTSVGLLHRPRPCCFRAEWRPLGVLGSRRLRLRETLFVSLSMRQRPEDVLLGRIAVFPVERLSVDGSMLPAGSPGCSSAIG